MDLLFKGKTKAKPIQNELEFEENKKDISNLDTFLDSASIESIYPFSFEEFPSHIESGNNFIRVLTIVDYPREVYGNWLSELRRKKGNITTVQYMESTNSSKMVNHYNNTIKNKLAELEKVYDPLKKKRINDQIEKAEEQLDSYLKKRSSYVNQYTYVFLQAESLKALEALTESVTNTLTKLQMKSMTPTKATYQAFWSAMPISENLLGEYTYQESNTETASSMIPFDDAEMLDLSANSDIEGVNKDTGSLIAINYLNKRKSLNQNMVVIGTSGVGKTTYMVQKILKYSSKGIKQFIIDPENEYSKIVNLLGGTVINLSANASTKVNPLEIFSDIIKEDQTEFDEIDLNELVNDKITRLKGFFESIKPNLENAEWAILEKVLRQTYVRVGVLQYKNIHEIKSEQFPTLSDFYNELETLKKNDVERFDYVKEFYYILESYVSGSTQLFNGHTNVKLNSKLVSFNLKDLQNSPNVQGACYLNTFSYLWDEITKNRTELIKLFVDEFHFLTRNQEASNFFFQAYKRFRKYNAGAIAGTQQIDDVMKGETADGTNLGQAIVGNSYTKVFFGLDDFGVDDLVERLKMKFSEREKQLLAKRRQGEALMIHGSQRAFNKIELTQEELRLIDPIQYEDKFPNEGEIDYEAQLMLTDKEILQARNFEA